MRLLLTVVTLHAHRLVLASPPHFTLFASRSRRSLRAAPDHRLFSTCRHARVLMGAADGRGGTPCSASVRGAAAEVAARARRAPSAGVLYLPPPPPPATATPIPAADAPPLAASAPSCAPTRSGGTSYSSCAEVAAPVAVRLAQPFAKAAAPVVLVHSLAAAVVAVGAAAAARFCFLHCLGVGGLIAGREGPSVRGSCGAHDEGSVRPPVEWTRAHPLARRRRVAVPGCRRHRGWRPCRSDGGRRGRHHPGNHTHDDGHRAASERHRVASEDERVTRRGSRPSA